MRVLVAGATGALGGPLLEQLTRAGHEVTGIARNPEGAKRVQERGGSVLLADVMDRDALLRAVENERFDAIVHELTALKKAPTRHADLAVTNTLRIQGTAHLLEAARATGARRFVTQSIVFGYGYHDHGTVPLTEEAPFGVPQGNSFDPHLAAMVATETQTTQAEGVDGIALRYGLFYGADIDAMAAMLRKRALPIVRHGGEIPFIHHHDAAAGTVAALERGRPGAIYNIVDDTPATFAELVTGVAAVRQTPRPLVVPRWLLRLAAPYGAALFGGISMRVSNELAKKELDWHPTYPSIRDGLAS